MQPIGELLDRPEEREPRPPLRGDPRLAVVGAGELPVDGCGRVGVVAEVRRRAARPLGSSRRGRRPRARPRASGRRTRALDLGRLAAEERAGGDLVDLRSERDAAAAAWDPRDLATACESYPAGSGTAGASNAGRRSALRSNVRIAAGRTDRHRARLARAPRCRRTMRANPPRTRHRRRRAGLGIRLPRPRVRRPSPGPDGCILNGHRSGGAPTKTRVARLHGMDDRRWPRDGRRAAGGARGAVGALPDDEGVTGYFESLAMQEELEEMHQRGPT